MILISKRHKKLRNSQVQNGNEVRYLGIIIGQNLNFNEHVDHITHRLKNITTEFGHCMEVVTSLR